MGVMLRNSCAVLCQCSRNFFTHHTLLSDRPKLVEKAVSAVVESKTQTEKVEKYVFSRYLKFVGNYGKTFGTKLESKFPTAIEVYRIFMTGMKDFYNDMVSYRKVSKKVRQLKGTKTLTRKEIELYHQLPKDMKKIAPVLLVSTLPFVSYVILPLLYYFPQQLMCTHFWTIQQRAQFSMRYLQQRLQYYRPVFRSLQAQLDFIDNCHPLKPHWENALAQLGSGLHPTPEQIVFFKPLFSDYPYSIPHLYPNHVNALLRMHGTHAYLKRRKRLEDFAEIIHDMDMAILREGGVERLSYEELRYASFLRGLNPVYMRLEDVSHWLNEWLSVSAQVDADSRSLLLHCPILLGYNQPSNWALLKY